MVTHFVPAIHRSGLCSADCTSMNLSKNEIIYASIEFAVHDAVTV